jgi:hypothetical protein
LVENHIRNVPSDESGEPVAISNILLKESEPCRLNSRYRLCESFEILPLSGGEVINPYHPLIEPEEPLSEM